MAAWEPLKRCTFFLARFKTVGVKSEDGLGIKISVKTLSIGTLGRIYCIAFRYKNTPPES